MLKNNFNTPGRRISHQIIVISPRGKSYAFHGRVTRLGGGSTLPNRFSRHFNP